MKRWTLAATILGSAMAFIDGTVVNIALPVLQRSFGATVRDAQWVVDAYLLVLSSLLLAGGALGDQLGRRRMFAAGVAIFAAASAWCGAAPDPHHLVAARALQGLGGALLVPGSLAIISATFPPNERGKAIGTWSAMTSLAVIAGPVFGGWLVEAVSWRAVFYINIPIAALTLLILRIASKDHGGQARLAVHLDWWGTSLITVSLGALTFALIEHASPILYLVSVVTMAAFVIVERRAENPIVPPVLFRSRTFAAANVLTLFLYAAMAAVTFLLPFNLIQVQGYSAARAGAAFLPFVATMSLLSRWMGALATRIGARVLLCVGPLVAAGGLLLLTRPSIGGSYWTTFFPGVLTIGIGMAITVAPLTTAVMTSIDDERHAGAASGVNNTVARAGSLLAIALFGAISVSIFSRNLDARLARESPSLRRAVLAQSSRLTAAAPPADADAATRGRVHDAIAQAFLGAFRINMFAAAALAAVAGVAGIATSGERAT